jgi:uncharacterized phosphosugar-binding protein
VTDPTPAGIRYLNVLETLLGHVRNDQWPNIRAAAVAVAEAVGAGNAVHVFGSGHSHMLAEELYYRAGGLVRIKPILFEGLMLHADAPLSTALERLAAIADTLFARHPMERGDVLILASNSGGTAVTSRFAQLAREHYVRVVAVTSLRYASSGDARPNELPRLNELADIVIDNGGEVGDAAVEIQGFDSKVAPTSTVVGAAILNAVVAEAVQLLVDRGTPPEVFTSSNVTGGEAANASFLGEKRPR